VTIRTVAGEGTEVAIRLPEAEESPTAVSGPAQAHGRPVRGEGTVLVVEDEQRLRAFVVRCLAGLGHMALAAAGAREARQLLLDRDGKVDLLFTDIVMPGDMDGADLARWAVARWPRLRVLLTTGFSAASRSRDADGRFPLLAKPFAESELATAVANTLHAPRSEQPSGRLGTSGVA
jgi:DNA-binding NtrC family response regulator